MSAKARRRYRTDVPLWLIVSVGVAGVLGLIPWFPNVDAESRLWHRLGTQINPEKERAAGMPVGVEGHALLAVIFALLIGWFIQALVIIVCARWRDPEPPSELPPQQPSTSGDGST